MDTKGHDTVRWSHGLLALALLLYAFSSHIIVLCYVQYGYQYTQRELFPDTTLNASSSKVSFCNLNKTSESYRERTAVQKVTSRWTIYIHIASSLPAVVTSAIVGSLSDKYGRKKMLLGNFTISFLSHTLTAIVIFMSFDINYIIVSSALSSLGGGFFGALSLGFAYVSDVSHTGKSRTLLITLLEASLGFGGAISGLASGYIIKNIGFVYTAVLAIASQILATLVVVLLPQSRPLNSTKNTEGSRRWESLRVAFTFYFEASRNRRKYILGIVTFTFASLSKLGKGNVDLLYSLNVPFCWSTVTIGYNSFSGVASTNLIGILGIKVLQKFFLEETIGILSAISNIAACAFQAFAYTTVMLFMVQLISVLSTLIFPMLRAIMSKMTPPDRQGALFAGIAVVEISASLCSTVGATSIYMETVDIMRGLTFLVFAALSLVVTVLLLIYRLKVGKTKTAPLLDDVDEKQTQHVDGVETTD